MATDLPIEQLPEAEEDLGVTLLGISVKTQEPDSQGDVRIAVRGELQRDSGKKKIDVTIKVAVYGPDDDVILTMQETFYRFKGFDVFDLLGFSPEKPARVRVWPVKF